MRGLKPEDIQAASAPLRSEKGGDEVYRHLRNAVLKGPVQAARVLPGLLLSNPEKGLEGRVKPYYYQEPTIANLLFQPWDIQDYLLPTGCGKTVGVSMGESLRMYFRTEKAAIIAATDEMTKYIRDTVHGYYNFGHAVFRDALMDSAKDRVVVQRPNGDVSELVCRTANLNNEGDSLLGLQGLTTILLDERSLLPDEIFFQKVDRITAPHGVDRLMVGITTTQTVNHVAEWCESHLLPRREKVVATVPHITAQGGAVYKATWRDGVKAGRYTQQYIERRHKQLGEELFASWYEAEFPATGEEQLIGPDLWRLMVDAQ